MFDGIALAILVAALLDTFILSGYFTYGGAIASAALIAFANGHGQDYVFLYAFFGVLSGEGLNVIVAEYPPIKRRVRRRLESLLEGTGVISRLSSVMIYSPNDRIAAIFVKYTVYRFLAATRPLNVIVMISLCRREIPNFLAVVIGSSIWVGFWTLVFSNTVEFFS